MCDRCRELQHELTDSRMDYDKEKAENVLLKLQMIKVKPQTIPAFYSINEIAEIIAVSTQTIRRLINTGQLSALKI